MAERNGAGEAKMAGDLVEAWKTHARINLYLLAAIPTEALADRAPKMRAVGRRPQGL